MTWGYLANLHVPSNWWYLGIFQLMHQLFITRLGYKSAYWSPGVEWPCESCYVLMHAICWSSNHHTCNIFLVAQGYCVQGNDCNCLPEWTGPNCDQGSTIFCSSVYFLVYRASCFILLSFLLNNKIYILRHLQCILIIWWIPVSTAICTPDIFDLRKLIYLYKHLSKI